MPWINTIIASSILEGIRLFKGRKEPKQYKNTVPYITTDHIVYDDTNKLILISAIQSYVNSMDSLTKSNIQEFLFEPMKRNALFCLNYKELIEPTDLQILSMLTVIYESNVVDAFIEDGSMSILIEKIKKL